MQATLRIELLGNFRLVYADQPITTVNTERSRCLLAYLVLNRGKPLSRQLLATLLWSDSSEAQARTNLRRELHRLRQVLPDADQFITVNTSTLEWQVQSAFTLDVAEFEQAMAEAEAARSHDREATVAALRQAVKLYQGDLLPTYYDEWVLSEQERVRQLYTQALEWLVRLLIDMQDSSIAMRYAQQLLELDPLNEAAHRNLMQLHALNGDRAGALRIYHRCMTLLRDEIGVDPSAATRELYDRLLHETDEPEKTREPEVQASLGGVFCPPSPPRFLCSTAVPPLIGREQQWTILRNWMATTGQPTNMLLVGEAGIGKTRLLEELANEVKNAGGYVLWGRGFEAEMLRPYGAWIDAVRTVALYAGVSLPTELSSFFPNSEATRNDPGDRSQIFDAVVSFLFELTTDNALTIIILDDIQWLDEASVALLHYATRLLSQSSVRIICAARQQEISHNEPVSKFLQALRREQRLDLMELPRLNQQQTIELTHTIAPDIDGIRVFADSGGNPLFALELARSKYCTHSVTHQRSSQINNLDGLIQDRLQQLNAAAKELLPWAAALGHSFNPTIVAQVAEFSSTKLLIAIEELEQQGIICPSSFNGEVRYDFAHDLVRQTAYNQLSEPRRRLIHTHVAQALKKQFATNHVFASDVAYHASLGGDHELAVSAALTAADRCLRLFAYTEAAELAQNGLHHCQYLTEPFRIRSQIELLKLIILAGVSKERVPQLEVELRHLIDQAHKLGLEDEEATGFEALIALNYDHGNFTSVHEHSLQVAERGRSTSPTTTARMLAYSGWCLADIGREMVRAEALLLEAQSLAARVGLEIIDVYCGLGCVRRHYGEFAEAQRLLQQAWQMAQADQDHWRVCACLTYLAMTEIEAGNPMVAIHYSQELATVADKISGEGSEGAVAIALSTVAQYVMNERDAEGSLSQALLTLHRMDANRMLAYCLTLAAEHDLNQRQVEAAISRAQTALEAAQIVNHPSEIALSWATLIRGRLLLGEYDRATVLLQTLHSEIDHKALSARARIAIDCIAQQLAPAS